MPPRPGNKKKGSSTKCVGEFQRSKAVATYGPGAIVDFTNYSGIMAGLEDWKITDMNSLPPGLPDDAVFFERNLSELLNKKFFVQATTNTNSRTKYAIKAYRFPSWYYCPKCHQLDRYKKIALPDNSTGENMKALYCNNCSTPNNKIRLIPSRFVAACPNGHITDFPYSWWVHRRKADKCDNPQLSLEYKGNTGGLDSIRITCKCGASESMQGCMDKNALRGYRCRSNMSWLGFDADNKPWYKESLECEAVLRTVQRGANNVYYPVNASVLTIPPWSAKIAKVFEKNRAVFDVIFKLPENMQEKSLQDHFNSYNSQYKCSWERFKKECFNYFCSDKKAEITEQSLRIDEYNALCGDDNTQHEDYFRTMSTVVPDEIKPYIEQIKIVSRLREVSAIRGFRRISPTNDGDGAEDGVFSREFTPISRTELDWLPAIQMYGEGIFIKFNTNAVKLWEKKNAGRYSKLSVKSNDSWIGKGMFNPKEPRYIMIHTFAHLLIRQLTSQCGYSTAALRERLYSTFIGSDEDMAGILIYTSSTDADGSLGGLAREGEGYRLCDTIYAMIDEASWCSNDPICIESTGQGFKGLSLAACHACSLLPETSCESANCLLDRASIVGLPDKKDVGFFAELL